MSEELGLPKGKWFTIAIEQLTAIAKKRKECDFRDSYRFRNLLCDLDHEIKTWIDLFMDKESIPAEFHEAVLKMLREITGGGRWPSDVLNKAIEILDLYEIQ